MKMDKRNVKVLVTGAGGQLGVDLVRALNHAGYTTYAFRHQELDITDGERVMDVFRELSPNIVIHAAAYTKVDQAESEPEEAYRVNAYGSRNIAIAAAEINAKLVYVSTDYVFDGASNQPYDEFAPVHPINVYGASKLAGERFVSALHRRYFIVRTSWVFGVHGHNFVKTMLTLAATNSEISVVSDQVGCPTYTVDLAACIIGLMETNHYGIYHVSNSGSCSWYEFAKEIFAQAGIESLIQVRPIPASEYLRPAHRPAYSVLEPMALRLSGHPILRSWQEALAAFCLELQGVQET